MNDYKDNIAVSISDLGDLAVEHWRLQKWASSSHSENERGLARHVARKLGSFLTELELTVCDLTGQPYDPGLAVEVIDTEQNSDPTARSPMIVEMITPIVCWRRQMIKTGQVVVGHGPNSETSKHEQVQQ